MIFVDTGAWYASEAYDDENHERATAFLKKDLATNKYGALVTSDYILDETLTLLRSRKGASAALGFATKIKKSKSVELVWIDKELFDKALEELSKFDSEERKQRDYSFTDCTSFTIMRDLSISTAFTFDNHFQKAGFRLAPN